MLAPRTKNKPATKPAHAIRCSQCKCDHKAAPTKTGLLRVPRGWHRHREQIYCGDCWSEKYVLRAVSIPVAGPVGSTWEEFRAALNAAWKLSTSATNWITTELYARDQRRGDQEKCPPQPRVYLYPETRRRFPEMPSQAAAALEQSVGKKYRAKRYDVLWTCAASLPTARWPQPFATPNQGWRAYYPPDGDRIPWIDVTLPGGRFTLRLRGGHEFRRQLQAFSQIESGEAVQGECALYRVRANGNDNRNGVEDRANGGGQRVHYRIMAKLVAWLPRAPSKDLAGVLFLSSDASAILFALDAKDSQSRLWTISGDQVRRWTAAHRAQLTRWSNDAKMELRPRMPFADRREAACLKFNRRLDSACKEFAAQVVNYAARRRFAEIRWIEPSLKFMEDFRWRTLFDRLAVKADEAGITFNREVIHADDQIEAQ